MGIGHDSAVGLWCRRATTDLRERKGLFDDDDDDEGVEDEVGVELDDEEPAELVLSLLPVRWVRAVGRQEEEAAVSKGRKVGSVRGRRTHWACGARRGLKAERARQTWRACEG